MKTVMVVDDEENLRILVKSLLENQGYEVVTAVNGDDCLRKLPKQKVDLILMDVMMPGTPVRDVVKKIKDTKIAFLSVVGVSDNEKEELQKSINVIDFIQKPFGIDELVQKVRKLISGQTTK